MLVLRSTRFSKARIKSQYSVGSPVNTGNLVSLFFQSGASGFNALVGMGSFSTNAGSGFSFFGSLWHSTLFSKFSSVSWGVGGNFLF